MAYILKHDWLEKAFAVLFNWNRASKVLPPASLKSTKFWLGIGFNPQLVKYEREGERTVEVVLEESGVYSISSVVGFPKLESSYFPGMD